MALVLSIVGIAFATLCVWLTVRITNRRERWAKCMAAALVVVLVGYPLSMGPWCWLFQHKLEPAWMEQAFWWFYKPILPMVWEPDHPLYTPFGWYLWLWNGIEP